MLSAELVGAVPVHALAKTRIVQPLSPTAHVPRATGTAKLVLKSGAKGRFSIKARHLAAGKSFDVVVGKVKVGTLDTGPGGGGVARFSTSPRGRTAMLGFDPRGAEIEIRDGDSGDDDLDSDMPDDKPDSAIGCCLGERDDDRETECEDMTATNCTAHGGKPTTAAGCLPDPCNNNPPPPTVVCCHTTSAGGAFVDDDPEAECEDDVSSAKCAAEGGMVVQATSCDPNPCQPVSPPQLVICCVPDDNESECERLTADHCSAVHGTTSAATSCDADPCGSGGGDGGD